VNFTGANLQNAAFSNAEIHDVSFDDADLSGCDLIEAKLDGVDLSKAKNYQPTPQLTAGAGPALSMLDALVRQADRIRFSFKIHRAGREEEIGFDSTGLKWGWPLRVPPHLSSLFRNWTRYQVASAVTMQLAKVLGKTSVRYETLNVMSNKSPKSGKELRELVMKAIEEAFAQPIPADGQLAAAAKTYRQGLRDQKRHPAAAARQGPKAETKARGGSQTADFRESRQARRPGHRHQYFP